VERVLAQLRADGRTPWLFECVRTPARQAWLYAQGRTRPGVIVTNAADHLRSWHGHGLAVDIVCRRTLWDDPAFFRALGRAVAAEGLTWGGAWPTLPDAPHLQWGGCPVGPRAADRTRTAADGMAATWAAYGAG
jgi:peptidoglycan L-alanyl-D-glutamate endopeptidase CwlK